MHCDYLQTNWASLLPMTEFAYNNSLHTSTNMTLFWALYRRNLKVISTEWGESRNSTAVRDMRETQRIVERLREKLEKAQTSQVKKYNKWKRNTPEYEVEDKVWLIRQLMRHIELYSRMNSLNDKLDHKKLEPFKVAKLISTHAVELKLSATMKIHWVFHVAALKWHDMSWSSWTEVEPAPPIVVDRTEEHKVKQILNSRTQGWGQRLEYYIKWIGYADAESMWEGAEAVVNAPEKVQEFHKAYPNWLRLNRQWADLITRRKYTN